MTARIVFVGTEEFSREMLGETLRLGGNVCAVFSIAREHAGNIPEWRELGEVARARGIEHHEVKSVREAQVVARLRELAPDVVFVMGIPQLVPRELIAAPRLGVVATHPSVLPVNRGLNAIPWHILKGEARGGLTLFLLGSRVDDGPVIARRTFGISLTDTSRTLYDKVVSAGREMLPELLAMVERGEIRATPQDESKATYLPPLGDRRIDWKQNARRIYDLVRAMTDPYAGAYAYLGSRKLTVWDAGFSHEPVVARPGQVLRISDRGIEVATGAGLVVLRIVQIDAAKEHALDVFSRSGVDLGATLT